MQTFLPYPEFQRSAAVLDDGRLGKQRVETLQILRALTLPEYGWRSHPAVAMWRGFIESLVVYGRTCAHVWMGRGYADNTLGLITEFAPEAGAVAPGALPPHDLLPWWLGEERLHRSHQSALVRKDPGHYRPFFPDVPDDLPYWWPDPRPLPQPRPVTEGKLQWVVRPSSAAALGVFLEQGLVGLGTTSGVDADASGRDAAALRQLLAERAPKRRPGRDLRQLETFLSDVKPGDQVGVPVEGGRTLLVGEITGDYIFATTREAGAPCHRRNVRWHSLLPRSAVNPPSTLQDPRALFQVRLHPDPQ